MPYPPAPGLRVAYDIDGSQALIRSAVTREWLDVHPSAQRDMNSERGGGLYVPNSSDWPASSNVDRTRELVLVFPQPMRIRGIFAHVRQVFHNDAPDGGPVHLVPEVSLSQDSTNGDDGTFMTVIPPYAELAGEEITVAATEALTGLPSPTTFGRGGISSNDLYRRHQAGEASFGIAPVTGAATRNIRSVRMQWLARGTIYGESFAVKLHVYGEPDTSAVGSRLDFWQSDLDQRFDVLDQDWGDLPQTSSKDRSFRVRNRSSDETAVNTRISVAPAVSSASPAPDGFFLLSLDGVTWVGEIVLGLLSPETTSPEIFIRLVVPSDAALSNWAPRIVAEVEEWT